MRQVLERIIGWQDRSPVPVFIRGQQLVTRGRLSRMLEGVRRSIAALGLQPGQRCAVELHHPVERLLVSLALASEGLVAVHFPPGLCRAQRAGFARRLDVQAVLLTNEKYELPGVATAKWSAEQFSATHGTFQLQRTIVGNATSLIVFSDGIDGRVRPIELDNQALDHRTQWAQEELYLDERSRVFTAGLGTAALPIALASLLCGSLHVYGSLEPLPEIVCHGITDAFVGPQLSSRLAEQVQYSAVRMPGLRRLHTFSERLNPTDVHALTSRLTENLYASYHLVETGVIATADASALNRSIHCRGDVAEGVELEILPVDGRPAEPHQPGDLRVRVGAGAGRYIDTDEPEVPALTGNWFSTGMLAHRDRSGALFLDGRKEFQEAHSQGRLTTGHIENALMRERVTQYAVAMWLRSEHGKPELFVAVPSANECGPTRRMLAQLLGDDTTVRVVQVESWPTTPFGEISLGRLRSQLLENS